MFSTSHLGKGLKWSCALVLTIFLGSFLTVYMIDRPALTIEGVNFFPDGDRNLKVKFKVKNNGRSTTKDIFIKLAIRKDEPGEFFPGDINRRFKKLNAGEAFNTELDIPLDKLASGNNGNVLIWLQLEFKDESSIRETVVELLFPGEQYKIHQSCQYFKGDNSCYSLEPEQFDKYEKEAIDILNQDK